MMRRGVSNWGEGSVDDYNNCGKIHERGRINVGFKDSEKVYDVYGTYLECMMCVC